MAEEKNIAFGLETVVLFKSPRGWSPFFHRVDTLAYGISLAGAVFWPRCSRNQLNCPASDEGAVISILARNFRKSGIKMIPDFIDVVE